VAAASARRAQQVSQRLCGCPARPPWHEDPAALAARQARALDLRARLRRRSRLQRIGFRARPPAGPQVWVYEEADEASASNLYVHHDIMLPAFPLALAWLDCHPGRAGEAGNLAAVRPARVGGSPVRLRSQARAEWTQRARVLIRALTRVLPSLPSTSAWCA